jgi:hypothetical protein
MFGMPIIKIKQLDAPKGSAYDKTRLRCSPTFVRELRKKRSKTMHPMLASQNAKALQPTEDKIDHARILYSHDAGGSKNV